MRKISKSRVDDDVVSSTNGSLLNDDRADSVNNDTNAIDADSDGDDGANAKAEEVNDRDSDADYGSKGSAKKSKSKSRAKKRKSTKEKEDNEDGDSDDGANDDSDADDGAKETPKKSKAKNKGKKRKSTKVDEEEEEEEEYEVEKVVDSKKIKGKLHYLIRWKGYNADSDTWEPENTLSCPELISKYNDEKENSKSKTNQDKKPKEKKGTKRKGKKDSNKSPSKRAKTEWDGEGADENAEYEVERILEVHHKKSGKREFLIHWKGWSSKFDSWEPEDNLNCSELIKKFMEKVDAAKSTDSRSLRVAPETTNRYTLQAPSTGRRLSKRRGQRQRK